MDAYCGDDTLGGDSGAYSGDLLDAYRGEFMGENAGLYNSDGDVGEYDGDVGEYDGDVGEYEGCATDHVGSV